MQINEKFYKYFIFTVYYINDYEKYLLTINTLSAIL